MSRDTLIFGGICLRIETVSIFLHSARNSSGVSLHFHSAIGWVRSACYKPGWLGGYYVGVAGSKRCEKLADSEISFQKQETWQFLNDNSLPYGFLSGKSVAPCCHLLGKL